MVNENPYEFKQEGQDPSTPGYEGQEPVILPPQTVEVGKPTSVTVFGILNCVFGGMGILCMPCAIYGSMITGEVTQIEATVFSTVWGIISFAVSFIFSIWELTVGIGLLKFAPWSRRGAVMYSAVIIIWVIFGNGLNILALSMGWITMPEGGIGVQVLGICMGFIGLIYPILLLIFMQTSKVKQAFAAIGG